MGFFTYYNYGGRQAGGGSSRIGCGWRGVYAVFEGKHARVIDWSTGETARIDAKEFRLHARPDKPRMGVVRRSLKRVGVRSSMATAARNHKQA